MPKIEWFCLSWPALNSSLYNKQLLDEAKYDMKNYADQGGCYLSKTEQIQKKSDWDKIRTHNIGRNNNFMIFQRWLKLMNNGLRIAI